MITDDQTNIVYFSEYIKTETEYKKSWFRIQAILDKHKIKYDFLKKTYDIWARDYMPVQTDINRFVQFRYEPSYLETDKYYRSVPEIICKANKINPVFSDINLDGGNIVKWKDKVIISERIYSENPEYTSRNKLVSEIEKLLNAEVILIPDIKDDFTGHADGMVRFYKEKIIIGNDRKIEEKDWTDGINIVLKKHNIDYIDMPMFEYMDKKHKHTAIGCYMNYLEIGNLIIFPIFQTDYNKDDEAFKLIKRKYPDKIIEPVNINEIVNHGGLMNCITWNIKE